MLSSLPSPMRVSLATEYDDTVPEFYRTIPLCGPVASLERRKSRPSRFSNWQRKNLFRL